MSTSEALCERELDLEMADVLPPRETLVTINVVVAPQVNVTTQTAVAIAANVLSKDAAAIAIASNSIIHG